MSASPSRSDELFTDIVSVDFLNFSFGGRSYTDQLHDAVSKTKALAGVKVEKVTMNGTTVIWCSHIFGFMGGSLGSAEGEKLLLALEAGLDEKLPVVIECKSGGARMQEGTSSLMQMAKISVAVDALRRNGIPFISVLADPTFGGVSASYAMQADIRIAVESARIGFAGPQVILNTMFEQNQSRYDKECPANFQSAAYLYNAGQLDMVIDSEPKNSLQSRIEDTVTRLCATLVAGAPSPYTLTPSETLSSIPNKSDLSAAFDYTRSRKMDRPQAQDIIGSLFTDFEELSGDGCFGRDNCIRGGIARFNGGAVVVMGTFKGHTPATMQEANYGMASPHGYRMAKRLFEMAERFNLPVITVVDTVGASPNFDSETQGQSEAIATNLTVMAGLKVPIVTLMIGEGGSGGALGIGMGNKIGMLSGGYFGVISPEGAASILGRYKDARHKAEQFPLDCNELAETQGIYANQLLSNGVDSIIWESAKSEETYNDFPVLASRIKAFVATSLVELQALSTDEIIEQRYNKFRALGTFLSIKEESERVKMIEDSDAKKGKARAARVPAIEPCKLVKHLANEVIAGTYSRFKELAPASCPLDSPAEPDIPKVVKAAGWTNAKKVLDEFGPEALSKWVKETSKTRILVTDTSMRDAHQSLLATRVRTEDILKGARVANESIKDAFSLECWGGATYDVTMRYLDECPWERLRQLRAAAPDICLQMLIRGANAVGYTSYPDNVVVEFIRLTALNGMDVFRIFDCFNIVENMKVAIDAVRACNKVAEVCLCYTGDVLTSEVYNLDYYASVAKEATEAGAHIIAIKDMAGLLRPREAGPLLAAVRAVTDLPIHFHTHSTSSGALTTCFEMAANGCDIIDFATASMADGTSQPSLNAFVAMMEGAPNDTGMRYMNLENYDMYWGKVRDMYSPFESNMKSGSARVFEHQIPGGQYSNLLVQCQSMGLSSRWEEVLDSYRDVNALFGNIVKVTPSSKCVGDLALYLVTCNLKTEDLYNPDITIDFPESVVGLMKGELGLPHRGFPADLEKLILKGQPKLAMRAGLVLPPVDFNENKAVLSAKFGYELSDEDGMSSLMYPAVFAGWKNRMKAKGELLRYLPTPVYFYGLEVSQKFSMYAPKDLVSAEAIVCKESESEVFVGVEHIKVSVELIRVGPLNKGNRAIVMVINGVTQTVEVADAGGAFVFSGDMADASKDSDVASPMPGVIEKISVKKGDAVKSGDVLCTITAMKMAVNVKAKQDCVVEGIVLEVGERVVEKALLMKLSVQ